MQTDCSTMIIQPSSVTLQGQKTSHHIVVLGALKPTDAQKGRPVKTSMVWPSPKKETEQEDMILSLQ